MPLAQLPPPDAEHYKLLTLVWPVVTFMVVTSIIVHGSSVRRLYAGQAHQHTHHHHVLHHGTRGWPLVDESPAQDLVSVEISGKDHV